MIIKALLFLLALLAPGFARADTASAILTINVGAASGLPVGSYVISQSGSGTGARLPNGVYPFSTTNGCITVNGNAVTLAACTGIFGQQLAWNGGSTGTGQIDGLFNINTGGTPEPIGSAGAPNAANGGTFTIRPVSGGYTIQESPSGLYIQDIPFGLGVTRAVWSINGGGGGGGTVAVDGSTNPPRAIAITSLVSQQWVWNGFTFDNSALRGMGNEFLADGNSGLPLMTNAGDNWTVTASGSGWTLEDQRTTNFLTIGSGTGTLDMIAAGTQAPTVWTMTPAGAQATISPTSIPALNNVVIGSTLANFSCSTNGVPCTPTNWTGTSLPSFVALNAATGALTVTAAAVAGSYTFYVSDGNYGPQLVTLTISTAPTPLANGIYVITSGQNSVDSGTSPAPGLNSTNSGTAQQWVWNGSTLQNVALESSANGFMADGNGGVPIPVLGTLANSDNWAILPNASGWSIQDLRTNRYLGISTGSNALSMLAVVSPAIPTVWTMTLVSGVALITPTIVTALDNLGSSAPIVTFTCVVNSATCSPASWTATSLPSFTSLNSSTGALTTNRSLTSGDINSYTFTVSDGSYGPTTATLTVGAAGNIAVVQSLMQVLFPQYPDVSYTYTLTLPQPVTIGNSIFGSGLYEPSPGGGNNFTPGPPDTIMVGSQRATIDDTNITIGFGPGMFTYHLFNVNNAATTITYSSSTQGHFIFEDEQFTEFSGLPSTASIDAHAAMFNVAPVGGPITSGPITPTVPGDFLYGAGFNYDFGEDALIPPAGWTLINNCASAPAQCTGASFDPAQMYQPAYNSIAPIAAAWLVPGDGGGANESWSGIIAVKGTGGGGSGGGGAVITPTNPTVSSNVGSGYTIATFTCTISGSPCYVTATPTATLTANPISIISGNSSTLTWGSTNAPSCAGTGFSTGGATSGTVSVSPTSTTVYTVTCNGAPANATVTVNPNTGSGPCPGGDSGFVPAGYKCVVADTDEFNGSGTYNTDDVINGKWISSIGGPPGQFQGNGYMSIAMTQNGLTSGGYYSIFNLPDAPSYMEWRRRYVPQQTYGELVQLWTSSGIPNDQKAGPYSIEETDSDMGEQCGAGGANGNGPYGVCSGWADWSNPLAPQFSGQFYGSIPISNGSGWHVIGMQRLTTPSPNGSIVISVDGTVQNVLQTGIIFNAFPSLGGTGTDRFTVNLFCTISSCPNDSELDVDYFRVYTPCGNVVC